MKWTKDWPKKDGYYWFYGDLFCNRQGDIRVGMHLVQVRGVKGGAIRVSEGNFVYQSEASDGYWTKARLPKPPDGAE